MRRFQALLFAACLVGCGADHGETDKGTPTSQDRVTAAGVQEHTVAHDGIERLYLAVSPGAAAAQSLPLVLVLHGGGGNARQAMESMRLSGLVERGALVVYPEGTSKKVLGKKLATWNAGACCGGAAADKVDDVGFLGRVIDDVTARYPVDPRRVYVTGHSNGAMMSYRAGCELSLGPLKFLRKRASHRARFFIVRYARKICFHGGAALSTDYRFFQLP